MIKNFLYNHKKIIKKTPRLAVVISHERNKWDLAAAKQLEVMVTSVFGSEWRSNIKVFEACGNRYGVQRDIIEKIQSPCNNDGPFDAVITFGTWCTQEIKRLLEVNPIGIPQFFCISGAPEDAGILKDLIFQKKYDSRMKNNLTGVISTTIDYSKQVKAIKALKPSTRNVVIPYDPQVSHDVLSEMVTLSKNKLVGELNKNGIDVTPVIITPQSNIDSLVSPHISDADFITTLNDSTASMQMSHLIRISQQKKKPLFTSELSSVIQGAAVGFGISGAHFVHLLVKQLYDFFVKELPFEMISVQQVVENGQIRFNPRTMEQQGLVLTDEQKNLMEMASIFCE